MSPDDVDQLTSELQELRSVINALTLAVTTLTRQAAEEITAKRAPFIEVIKPSDPRYAMGIQAFHQDSILQPRLTTFANLRPSNNPPQDQGAHVQTYVKPPRRDKGTKRPNYPKVTYSRCCGAERRKRSKHDGKCPECR